MVSVEIISKIFWKKIPNRNFSHQNLKQLNYNVNCLANAKKKNIFGIDSQKQIKNLLQYSRTMKGDVLCCNTHQNLSEVTDLLSLVNKIFHKKYKIKQRFFCLFLFLSAHQMLLIFFNDN